MSYEGVSSDNVVLSAIIDRDDEFKMPPPESVYRPKKQLKRKLHSKTVLEEDSYVDALSQIIERDYFPDTAKLRTHLELLNAHDNNNTAAVSAIHRQILTEHRRSTSTPSRTHGQSQTPNPRVSIDDGTGDEKSVPIDGLTVDEFLKIYTSEDNESFEILQQRDLEKWRQIRHWAYDSESTEEGDYEKRPGMLMLYHMGGKVLSAQQRGKMDALLELPKSVGDDKPNNLDTWRFRVRNNLMFPPSLLDSEYGSNSINADHSSTSSNQALLCNNPSTNNNRLESSDSSASQTSLVRKPSVTANRWVGTSTRAAKMIQKGNTSLRKAPAMYSHSGITPSPLEPPHTPSVMSESFSESSSVTYHEGERSEKAKDKAYRFLSMTPSPMPGAGGESPLMTWGILGGTPLILDPPESINESRMLQNLTSFSYQSSLLSVGLEAHGGGCTGPMYVPPPVQHRELLAQSLAAKEKSRKAAAKDVGLINSASRPSGMSSSLRKSSSSSGSTVMTSARHKLTPAALSLAARLTGNRQGSSSSVRPGQQEASNPFSSDALTRSYTALGSGSGRRSKDTSAGRKRDPSSALESPRIHHHSAMNTDNLLHLS